AGFGPQRGAERRRRGIELCVGRRLRLAAQGLFGGGDGGAEALGGLAVEGDEEIVRGRFGKRGGCVALRSQEVEVHRRAHGDGRVTHARSPPHFPAYQHQEGGVVVRVFLDQ